MPSRPPQADRKAGLLGLQIWIAGRAYALGRSVEGDPQKQATIEGTATLTIAVRDPRGQLLELLADESMLLDDGVRVRVDGVDWMLQSLSVDGDTGTLVTLTFEDAVSWRLKQLLAVPSVQAQRDDDARAGRAAPGSRRRAARRWNG